MPHLSRRRLITLSAQAAATAAWARSLPRGPFLVKAQTAAPGQFSDVYAALDRYAEQYMHDMNSPGMTLGLSAREGVLRTSTYAFSDIKLKQPVKSDDLFHIGSITKSFAAFCLLQLRDEGKLDLQRPIASYLPWFKVKSRFEPITVHHLMTHSAGLAGNSPTFLPDPAAQHEAANPPGKFFHYCNMGWDVLGHLIETLDGGSWAESVRKRVLAPLGMNATEPVITADIRERTAMSYVPYHSERPYPRYGIANEASELIFDKASGSIASTPGDMALYMHALLNRGKGLKARIASEEGFALFSKPHIKAEEFGPTASYGYGMAVDTMDGHTILRHTGGMVSFMSALQLDMDAGFGAWASINAQFGYRPNPVAIYALKALQASRDGKPLPAMPPPDPPNVVKNAAEYAGEYVAPDGRKLHFSFAGERLYLENAGKRIELQASGGDSFIAPDPQWEHFNLVFGREKSGKTETSSTGDKKDENLPPVIEVSWGPDWFAGAGYKGPNQFNHPQQWEQLVGHYRNDSPWEGSFHVLINRDKLTLDGQLVLEAMPDGRFRLTDEPNSPEWLWFGDVVNGKARHAKLSGQDYWRVT